MTNEAQRAAIQQMIQRHTAAASATQKTARESLIKEGVYTTKGHLSPAFGGKKSASR
jgi:hypothetical protein